MEGCEDVQFKQHTFTKFLIGEKNSSLDIHHCMQAVYGDKCVDISIVRCWVQEFQQEEMGEAWLCGEANDCKR